MKSSILLFLSLSSSSIHAADPTVDPITTSSQNKLRAAETSQLAAIKTEQQKTNELIKDKATVADKPITSPEYNEAKMGKTHMHRDDGDKCGHAYCSDLTEYKPQPMPENEFIHLCIEAHHDWEQEVDYSLSCDPQNPVRLLAQAAEELRKRTMQKIDDTRNQKNEMKSDTYAADSAEAARAQIRQKDDVEKGRKQLQAGTLLAQKIDITKHIRDKRDAMKIKVRCKNGNKVDSTYTAVDGERQVICPPDIIQKVDMEADQGYQKIDDMGLVDSAVEGKK